MSKPLSVVVPHGEAAAISVLNGTPSVSPAVAYLESLGSEVSKRTMISPLNRAAKIIDDRLTGIDAWKFVPWEMMKAFHVRAVMAGITGSPATRNKALAALKGVARAAWEMQMLDTEELTRIRSIKGDTGSREIAGRYVPAGEIKSLLRACAEDASPAGARDGAMIALAALTGARRAEIASILLENLSEPEEGRYRIQVIGKRNRQRTLFISGNTALALVDWLNIRIEPGCKEGSLFCPILKSGRLLPEKSLSTTALDRILLKRSAQADIADLDWHDLRRTTTSNLLDAGADISIVAGLLGHANVQTTARYDRRGEYARIKASELIAVPYFKRSSRGDSIE